MAHETTGLLGEIRTYVTRILGVIDATLRPLLRRGKRHLDRIRVAPRQRVTGTAHNVQQRCVLFAVAVGHTSDGSKACLPNGCVQCGTTPLSVWGTVGIPTLLVSESRRKEDANGT